MKKILEIALGCMLSHFTARAQTFAPIELPRIDSVVIEAKDYRLFHYHLVSEEVSKVMRYDTSDNIFNDKSNCFSRLIFTNQSHFFNVPTVPLSHLKYLKEQNVILGLSNFTIGLYQIVIYSEEGKLISKRSLNSFELKFNGSDLQSFVKLNPGLIECLRQGTVVEKVGANYSIELSRCLIDRVGKDSIIKNKGFAVNHSFPNMDPSIDEGRFRFQRYYRTFSISNPFNSLVMENGVPQKLILNAEDGSPVEIALRSNCNIDDEIR